MLFAGFCSYRPHLDEQIRCIIPNPASKIDERLSDTVRLCITLLLIFGAILLVEDDENSLPDIAPARRGDALGMAKCLEMAGGASVIRIILVDDRAAPARTARAGRHASTAGRA
jgi:hypothetical protein